MSCSTAALQLCSDRHHPGDTTDRDTQVAALVPKGQWVGDCSALPDPTAPCLEKTVYCQQQSTALTPVPFSLSTGGIQGPQGDMDLRCFREIIGKWHVLWESILAPSRNHRVIYDGKNLRSQSLTANLALPRSPLNHVSVYQSSLGHFVPTVF